MKKLLPIVGVALFLILCYIIEVKYLQTNIRQFLFNGKENFLGIMTYGIFHANWRHLMGNLFGLILFGFVLQKFYYKDSNFKLLIWFYFSTAFIHALIYQLDFDYVGASGWIFALCWYVVIQGLISENKFNICLSLVLLSFNSYLIYGMTPAATGVAWDAHLAGGITGILTHFLRLPFLKSS